MCSKNTVPTKRKKSTASYLRAAKLQLHSSIFPGMVADKNHGGILTWADPHSNGSCAGFSPASPFTLLSVETFRTAIFDKINYVVIISQIPRFVNPISGKISFLHKVFVPNWFDFAVNFL